MRKCIFSLVWGLSLLVWGNGNVYVSRFWHNHQPIYWPEWNGNGGETERVQYAWDSIVLKGGQTYNSGAAHPENDLVQIFSVADRVNAYQSGPRNSLAGLDSRAGFAMSYSGSLIDNVRNLGANNQLGYGGGWWNGNREASNWTTPAGSRRLDLLGFTYHHSLGAVLPKAVFRKELRIFKQAWWKAWDKNPNLSDHSKGFFPTEMAFSRHMVDVLVDEGFEWTIVASHHLSRTCPTYFNQFDLANNSYGIFSSPPNRSDLLGPSPTSGWWYSEPNPGNAAWNVSPYAYQLHRAQYINPETGAEKTLIMVPSDDVLSYRYGYSNEGIGKIQGFISPFATDPSRPVIVMPSSDGDNAWGGGSSSWFEATPQLFNDSANAGYQPTTPQDFVNAHGAAAPVAHVEDGAWIFPESDYGSPYFLKWVEPPVKTTTATNTVPGTLVDLETPGFALKFFSWAPIIAGANWCETAEQIWTGNGGTVEDWKVQSAYDWNGSYNNPNVVERAWHIYLAGLDSGFNYYGGLGNDDEVKSSLATRRAVEILQTYMDANIASDATGPTIFKPQRFPYNPGGYTFGWFNSIPGGDTRYLKKMPSEFYIWSHVYDVSDVASVVLKVRIDADGINPMDSVQNETYAGGSEVGSWISIPMTKRVLPNNSTDLNAAANNGQINYFSDALSPEIADYYFARITDSSVAGFRGKLLDYYIEAQDGRGNLRKSEIQQVFVEDDGESSAPQPAQVTWDPAQPTDCPGSMLDVQYVPNDGVLSNAVSVTISYSIDAWSNSVDQVMTESNGVFSASLPLVSGTRSLVFAFQDGMGTWDNNGGADWKVPVRACPIPSTAMIFPANPTGCVEVTLYYDPGTDLLAGRTNLIAHLGFNGFESVTPLAMTYTNGLWEVRFTPEPGVTEINTAFRDADTPTWDNNSGADWSWPVVGCVGPFDPDLCAITATPVVSSDPADGADQNNPGDNFDLDPTGGAAETYSQGGFGSFGRVYINVDDQALYIGAEGAHPDGSNNVMVVFLSLDTLSLDRVNLWDESGSPQALDLLHNVAFAHPVDLAILIGDEYGDGIYPNFNVGTGYDHGQGIYSLGASTFDPVAGAVLSQFDGSGTNATVSADDDGGDRQTDRWEARIPWTALNAAGVADLSDLRISGLILSDYADGVDRYLSGNFLGSQAQSVTEVDIYNNFGTAFVTLTPLSVCLPHLDGDADGMSNEYELRYFGSAGAGDINADDDLDGHTNGDELKLGTRPNDPASALIVYEVQNPSTTPDVWWQTVGGKTYRVDINDSPTLDPMQWVELGQSTETDVADGEPDTQHMADPTPIAGQRAYRVVLVE